MFFFVDLETTGLSEESCDILELGIVIASPDLEVLSGRSWLVQPNNPLGVYKKRVHEKVIEMHTKNGLFAAIDAGKGMDRHDVAAQAISFCSEFEKDLSKKPLCGSSVHFDRRFLRRWMPVLDEIFSYRNIDVSTLKELFRVWAPNMPTLPKNDSEHRALPDLEATIKELRYYRKFFDFSEEVASEAVA